MKKDHNVIFMPKFPIMFFFSFGSGATPGNAQKLLLAFYLVITSGWLRGSHVGTGDRI